MRPGRGGCLIVSGNALMLGLAIASWTWLLGMGIGFGVYVWASVYTVSMTCVVIWLVVDGIVRRDDE